ncbi:hypothetical protein HQ533_03780 [Candidatus Woesearchaeota archaeon]|nr:hypothetical protein [Candidatus Woesearchaeota archaeon]
MIPVQVQKVLELKGAYRLHPKSPSSIYAHISVPVKQDGQDVQYAMLAIFPQHGVMHLGEINPKTKMFENYDPKMHTLALYTRAENNVVNQVSVPSELFERLKTIDEVLDIEGISVKRELIPE